MKKIYYAMLACLVFLLSASSSSAILYTERYSTTFDLNNDQQIDLLDVSQSVTWLQSNQHQNCYPYYQAKLASSTAYSVSDSWCSSLLGLVMDAVSNQNYNVIVDINSDGKVDLSDVSLISGWYASSNGQACHYHFTKEYNHNDIHWCAGIYQGIADNFSEAVGGPDVGIDYITLSPSEPVLNEVVEMKVQARNVGNTSIYNQATLDNVHKVLGNLVVSESILPQVSSSNQIEPGETFYYIYKGKFTRLGNQFLSFIYNPGSTEEELNFFNNSAILRTRVYSASPAGTYSSNLDIVSSRVDQLGTNSARIYWQASTGSQGHYRYATSSEALANLAWLTTGVSDDPGMTGNAYASLLSLDNLQARTKYYIELKKTTGVMGESNYHYGHSVVLNFNTLASDGDDDNISMEKVKVCHVVGNGKSNTLEIDENALSAHLAHGDKKGACDIDDDDIVRPILPVNTKLIDRVRGRILLQVQNHGEAWYVNPKDDKRFYLKDGVTAYSLMREAGLGISNDDLAKIPVGFEDRFSDTDTDGDGLADKLESGLGTDPNKADTDNDGVKDKAEILAGTNPLGAGSLTSDGSLVNRLRGRIVLQVQSRGEAWYIDPSDGKRYYMRDGDAAYQIMRFRSLGITNDDLSKIAE